MWLYHGTSMVQKTCTMVHPWYKNLVPWYIMVYHGLPVSIYRGIPWVLPWFTSFKIPWYSVVYHAFYHGLPVFKIPWYNLPWYKYTMVQIVSWYKFVPWYNVPWYNLPWYKLYTWYLFIREDCLVCSRGLQWMGKCWFALAGSLSHTGNIPFSSSDRLPEEAKICQAKGYHREGLFVLTGQKDTYPPPWESIGYVLETY